MYHPSYEDASFTRHTLCTCWRSPKATLHHSHNSAWTTRHWSPTTSPSDHRNWNPGRIQRLRLPSGGRRWSVLTASPSTFPCATCTLPLMSVFRAMLVTNRSSREAIRLPALLPLLLEKQLQDWRMGWSAEILLKYLEAHESDHLQTEPAVQHVPPQWQIKCIKH